MSGIAPISYRMRVYGPFEIKTILFCDEPKPWTLEEVRDSVRAHVANIPGVDGCILYDANQKEIARFERQSTGGIIEGPPQNS